MIEKDNKIDQKLNIIVSLLLRIASEGKNLKLKDQIKDLSSFGLNSNDIAIILNKKAAHISKELTGIKKNK